MARVVEFPDAHWVKREPHSGDVADEWARMVCAALNDMQDVDATVSAYIHDGGSLRALMSWTNGAGEVRHAAPLERFTPGAPDAATAKALAEHMIYTYKSDGGVA